MGVLTPLTRGCGRLGANLDTMYTQCDATNILHTQLRISTPSGGMGYFLSGQHAEVLTLPLLFTLADTSPTTKLDGLAANNCQGVNTRQFAYFLHGRFCL